MSARKARGMTNRGREATYQSGFFVAALVLVILVMLFVAVLFGLRLQESKTRCQSENVALSDTEEYSTDPASIPEEPESLKKSVEENNADSKKQINNSECQ